MPNILYDFECSVMLQRMILLLNKNEKFYLGILKQVLGVNKKVSNIQVLVEVGQRPESFNIKKVFKKVFFH